jgi:formate hydrogenlyase transcriptional activator
VIERAVILSPGPVLQVPLEELEVRSDAPVTSSDSGRSMRAMLENTERQQILLALEQANWTIAGANGAAARLGMKRSTLQSRMQKLGIRISRNAK